MRPKVKFKRVSAAPGFALPQYMSPGAAGMDLRAALDQEVLLKSGDRKLVPTGFSMELPEGFEAQIRPRSGLALKHGVTCLNSPGTIDHDYRGEVKVILANLGTEDFSIHAGDRIAQMVIHQVYQADLELVEDLTPTDRGANGFGSTGHKQTSAR